MSFYTEQELTYKKTAVIGLGASGGFFSLLALKNPCNIITGFDLNEPFSTLLKTGGGRCNITYDEDDIKDFVQNYPRGSKFLLSVFSRFSAAQARELFEKLGVKTYVQPDKRVFPETDSSALTIKTLAAHLNAPNFTHKKEKVISASKSAKGFEIKTNQGVYIFDRLVIASGGGNTGFFSSFGHKIKPLRPSLTALDIREKEFYSLSGLSFHNARIKARLEKRSYEAEGDFLFSHKSITGPLVFKISALSAYDDFAEDKPLEITLKTSGCSPEMIENELKANAKKSIKNVFSKFAPESFISLICSINNIDGNKQAAQLKKQEKEILIQALTALKLHAEGRIKNSEIVTAGGVSLDEINQKTMESKLIPGLFFTGEVLDIDGFTGGFNLQNCWSTAYICSLNFITPAKN